jgi:uncharacterized protein (TIGR02117 family)
VHKFTFNKSTEIKLKNVNSYPSISQMYPAFLVDHKMPMRQSILLTILLVIIFVGISCSEVFAAEPERASGHEVYVVKQGWHTGFVVPATAIQQALPGLKQRFGSAPYIEFGWGDEAFYQSEEETVGITLRAIFLPTDTVMHVVAVPMRVDKYFQHSDMQKLCLDDAGYAALIAYISNGFYRDHAGNIQPLNQGLYGDSQFYQGVGRFHIMNTCNTWTAKGLKSAGIDISTTFNPTASSIMSHLSVVDSPARIKLTERC